MDSVKTPSNPDLTRTTTRTQPGPNLTEDPFAHLVGRGTPWGTICWSDPAAPRIELFGPPPTMPPPPPPPPPPPGPPPPRIGLPTPARSIPADEERILAQQDSQRRQLAWLAERKAEGAHQAPAPPPRDFRIHDLAMALKEALIWGWVEEKPGPRYRVPRRIDGDLWRWAEVNGKRAAYDTIKEAVDRVVDAFN